MIDHYENLFSAKQRPIITIIYLILFILDGMIKAKDGFLKNKIFSL